MRIGNIKGVYLQYQGAAQPVETFDRVAYPFQAKNDRTCLLTNLRHVTYLLQTGREYQIVGVEADDADGTAAPTTADTTTTGVETPAVTTGPVKTSKPRAGKGKPKAKKGRR